MRKLLLMLTLAIIGSIAFSSTPAMASHKTCTLTTQPNGHHHKHKHKKHKKLNESASRTAA
jgi:hypothetical protein